MKIVFAISAALAFSATTALAGDLAVAAKSTGVAAPQAGPTLMSDAQMDAVVGAGGPPFNFPPHPSELSDGRAAVDTVVPLSVATPPPFLP